jgi:hypothetical protein
LIQILDTDNINPKHDLKLLLYVELTTLMSVLADMRNRKYRNIKMKISDKDLNKIQDLIILIKIEPQHEYIYELMELLNLDASVIDGKTRRTEYALSLDSDFRGPRGALSFINGSDKIWSNK